MVVEDDPRMRRIITKVLTSCGMMVRAAGDGVEALRAFNQSRHEPELICADIKMPNMDGREFAKRLRQQGVGVPIIFISGTIQPSEEGYREKSHIYLMPKPFSPARLAEIVKDLLAKRKPSVGPRTAPPQPGDSGQLPPVEDGSTSGYESGEFKLGDESASTPGTNPG
jgi:two-component system, OmpR family, response regulator